VKGIAHSTSHQEVRDSIPLLNKTLFITRLVENQPTN